MGDGDKVNGRLRLTDSWLEVEVATSSTTILGGGRVGRIVGAAHQVEVEVQVVGGGAAHQVHLRLAQHPAPTGRQLGLWNKPESH